MPLLEIKNVYKSYLEPSSSAVRGVSFDVLAGELFALVGESGCGKTTLLKLIAGLEELDKGSVVLNGKAVTGPSQNLIPGHPDIKVIFQDFKLFPNISVAANIAYALRSYQKSYQQARTEELLAVCKLTTVRDKLPRHLSGGEQQRVALARALAEEPVLLLLDEPFSNLDVLLKFRLKNELQDIIKSQGVTAIFVTHDTADALSMADRIAVMQKGKLLQLDSPQQVYGHPANPYVAHFFGNANILNAQMLKSVAPEIPLPEDAVNQNAKLCIRAENIKIGNKDECSFTGKISRIHFLGAYLEVEVAVGTNCDLILRTDIQLLHPGDTIPMYVDVAKIHLFQS